MVDLMSSSSFSSRHLSGRRGEEFDDHPSMLRISQLSMNPPPLPLASSPSTASAGPMECRWGPYINNGGTVLAVAGDDYAVVAGDTRLSMGFSIHTRYSSKITKLTDKCVIATSGMQAEMVTLHRLLKVKIQFYQHEHGKAPSVNAVAQLLSTVLYQKRFFPYYTFNMIVGLDDKGKGQVYSYDAVGSFESHPYGSTGTGGSLMMSILDNQLGKTNQLLPSSPPTKLEVIDLVKDVITSAGERDIYTGDQAEVMVLDSSGISISHVELRKD